MKNPLSSTIRDYLISWMHFVFDIFALLAYFQTEPAALKVKEILKQAQKEDAAILLSVMNLGEIAYTVERKMGRETSQETLHDISTLLVHRYPHVPSDTHLRGAGSREW